MRLSEAEYKNLVNKRNPQPAKKRQGTRSPLKDLAAASTCVRVVEFQGQVSIELPIKTVSELNTREHWSVKNKRKKGQQDMVKVCWPGAKISQRIARAPYIVTFTRIAPGKLDLGDNLNSAFKGIRDSVAALLGIDDGSDLIEWRYAQEPGSKDYRVRIEIKEKR